MFHFWKWLAVSVVCAALAYAALIGLSVLVIPWRPERFDTHVVNTTERGWVNEARYFVLNSDALSDDQDRIIILGASNARDPFRPEIMEPALPGWRVANASLSGASIGELADAVDLVYLAKQPGDEGRTVFVLALNYLQFLSPRFAEGTDNPLAIEAKRGGLNARRDGRLQSRYPRPFEDVMEAAFRPQAVAASLPRRTFSAIFVNPDLPAIKDFVDRFRSDDPLSRWTEFIGEQSDLNAVEVPPEVQRALLAQRRAGAGGDRPLAASEFHKLADLIDLIRSRGDTVVLVDLPLPNWHRSGVPVAEASYQDGVTAVLTRHQGDPSVDQVSLREFDGDANFFDSGHPKPKLWPAFSRRLAEKLATSVAPTQATGPSGAVR